MEHDDIERETDAILQKLAGVEIDHVTEVERRWAVRRAVQMALVSSELPVEALRELLSTHEEQIDVHEQPGDV